MFRRSLTVEIHIAIANPALAKTKGIYVVSGSSVQLPSTSDTDLSVPVELPIQICPTHSTPVTIVSFPSPSSNPSASLFKYASRLCSQLVHPVFPQHEQPARSSFVLPQRVLPLVLPAGPLASPIPNPLTSPSISPLAHSCSAVGGHFAPVVYTILYCTILYTTLHYTTYTTLYCNIHF